MMLLTTSLPLLPPPSASLLPPLTTPASSDPTLPNHASHQHLHHQSSRRAKHSASLASRNNTLIALSTDERTISQRKMAIAMFGYAWLKPAGCAKTMLGRREEEVEREEVERQLREVELQERLAQEAEEHDRLARLNETGEAEEGRDLDEDIPDAGGEGEEGEESEEEYDEYGDGEEAEGGEGMEADLDDEIPDADDQDDQDEDEPLSPAGADGGWVYDTRREPDTDDEEQLPHPLPLPLPLPRHDDPSAIRGHGRHATVAGVRVPISGGEDDYDEREAEDLADAMLDEDEMFDHDVHRSAGYAVREERDLDDDVPTAEDEQGWEHTDTELEESEMDISILPGQAQLARISPTGIAQQSRRSSGHVAATQRSSDPWITGPSPIPSPHQAQGHILPRHRATPNPISMSAVYPTSTRSASTRAARIVSGNRQRPYRPDRGHPNTRHQLQMAHTPDMLDSPLDADEDEIETDIDVDIDTPDPDPDPFIAPPHPRAAPTGRGNLRGNTTTGHTQTQTRTGTGAGPGNTSPSRAAAARTWLDDAAAAVGMGGGSRDGSGSARRTLFQRATRRRGNPDVNATAAPSNGGSSGGLFPSPNPNTNAEAGAATAEEWDTPDRTTANEGQQFKVKGDEVDDSWAHEGGRLSKKHEIVEQWRD